MKPLKQQLPPGRTLEQVWNHYIVESEIAGRLKRAGKDERRRIFETMYDELFTKVPDHPRLTRRDDAGLTQGAIRSNMVLFGRFLSQESVVVEFAPGDCQFAAALAPRVRRIIGVDICDQRSPGLAWPENFDLIVYDGDRVSGVAPGSVDVAISNQLLEHFHPDDLTAHLALVHDLLRDGGCYVFCAPHAIGGPWDVSRYFSDVAEGFHLKEQSYTEIDLSLRQAGFHRVDAFWIKRAVIAKIPIPVYRMAEAVLGRIPRSAARKAARFIVPMVYCAAYK